MSSALRISSILAGVSALLLIFIRVIPSWGVILLILSVLIHGIGLTYHTRQAGKSPVRIFLLLHSAWLLFGAGGVIFLVEHVLAHIVIVMFSSIVLLIYDYHGLRFLMVPAQRSREVLLRTTRMVQVYALYLAGASLFGLVVFAQLNVIWVLVGMGIEVLSSVYAYLRFVEKRTAHRIIACAILTLVVIEVAWATLLLPFGYGVVSLFPAMTFALALPLLEQVAGEPRRDKIRKIVYGVAGVLLLLILLLVRWL